MRITDYESTRNLNDVGLVLTPDEAEELYIYLHKMLGQRDLTKAYLTEIGGAGIERELSVTIERPASRLQLIA